MRALAAATDNVITDRAKAPDSALTSAAARASSPARPSASRSRRRGARCRLPDIAGASARARRDPARHPGRAGRHRQRAILELELAADDDLLGLPGVVRVAGVGQVGHGGGQVRHRGQRDAHMRVAVHRQPDAPGAADARQLDRGAQPAPEVMVAQDDLHAAQRDRAGRSAKLTQHILVASGRLQARATSAMSSLPAVGSS